MLALFVLSDVFSTNKKKLTQLELFLCFGSNIVRAVAGIYHCNTPLPIAKGSWLLVYQHLVTETIECDVNNTVIVHRSFAIIGITTSINSYNTSIS
jgi:hypothetical protein